jgi:hypothetical protein
MTITWQSSKEIECVAADTKPANAEEGTEAYETDTGKRYRMTSTVWTVIDVFGVSLDALNNVDTVTDPPENNDVLTYVSGSSTWKPSPPPGATGGEANTVTNVGTGSQLAKAKSGVDIPLRTLTATSSKIALSQNTNDVGIDVTETNLTLANLSGTIGDSKISALAYSKLTSVPSTLVKTDQVNTFGAFAQTFPYDMVRILNSAGTFYSQLRSAATANRTPTIPDNSETLTSASTTDTFTNKTFNADGTGNSITNIENADIKAAAGIVYSKLSLGTSIVNADIAAGAAIAKTKLASLDVVNADVNASAAIVYSKLSLTGGIVNADINASAGIVDSKLAQITTKAKLPSDTVYTGDTQTLSAKTITGLKLNVAAKTADYTATATDDFIPCSPAANMTITLPAAASNTGKWYNIQKINSNGFTVTIDPNSSELINGVSTMVLRAQYQGAIIYCDGSAWFSFPNMTERTGTATATANGTDTVFSIAHGLGVDAYNALVICSSHTNTFTYVTDTTNITVTFTSAPSATPTATIKFHWRAVQ